MGACYACVRVVRRYVSTGRIRVPVRILVARRRKRPPAQTPAASSAAGAARARSHVDPGHGRFRGCVIETRSGGRKEPIASDHGCWTSCQEGPCLRLPFLKKKFVLVLIPVDAHCRRLLARLEYTDGRRLPVVPTRSTLAVQGDTRSGYVDMEFSEGAAGPPSIFIAGSVTWRVLRDCF
ncbi:unnamed protein product (mitochondrion) [Plasmodiophora brassicae]|uniref:Uncharacterized protein n=1 Tax=Plasmodiophora brassicae TaxID=37360 RepID=A0A3P3YPW0_PLABS|nr:unnamed protein product [Plasmodiophora brassicae]